MPAYSVYALFHENKMFSLNSRSGIILNLALQKEGRAWGKYPVSADEDCTNKCKKDQQLKC